MQILHRTLNLVQYCRVNKSYHCFMRYFTLRWVFLASWSLVNSWESCLTIMSSCCGVVWEERKLLGILMSFTFDIRSGWENVELWGEHLIKISLREKYDLNNNRRSQSRQNKRMAKRARSIIDRIITRVRAVHSTKNINNLAIGKHVLARWLHWLAPFSNVGMVLVGRMGNPQGCSSTAYLGARIRGTIHTIRCVLHTRATNNSV